MPRNLKCFTSVLTERGNFVQLANTISIIDKGIRIQARIGKEHIRNCLGKIDVFK